MSKVRTEANGSKNNEWETPEYIYDIINKEFNFNWDLACISKNCKTEDGCMFDKGINGLDWIPEPNKEYRIWCNPPYSIQLKPKFIERCYTLSQLENVKEVVMLIPSTTETKHFHEILIPNCEIRFIHKRVRFKGINTKGKYVTDKTGQSGSMVVVFNRKPKMCVFQKKKGCGKEFHNGWGSTWTCGSLGEGFCQECKDALNAKDDLNSEESEQ